MSPVSGVEGLISSVCAFCSAWGVSFLFQNKLTNTPWILSYRCFEKKIYIMVMKHVSILQMIARPFWIFLIDSICSLSHSYASLLFFRSSINILLYLSDFLLTYIYISFSIDVYMIITHYECLIFIDFWLSFIHWILYIFWICTVPGFFQQQQICFVDICFPHLYINSYFLEFIWNI